MYKKSIENIGKYQVIRLFHEKSGHYLKIVPEKGAIISDFGMHGVSLLKGYDNIEELETLAWSRGALLSPFPNRVRDGKFNFAGTEYAFPINNADTHTAIHGLVRKSAFQLDSVEVNAADCRVVCSHDYAGDLEYFPFPFKTRVIYELNNEALTFTLTTENTGTKKMPAGLGWHPYFKISDNVEDCKLKLPPLSMVHIDAQMIPTGERSDFTKFAESKPIDDYNFDNCFALQGENETAEVRLESDKGILRYFQDTKYPFLQIFTPPQRDCIAFEPMTCNVDAFNNGEGLRVLESGEAISLRCGVGFELV